MHIGQALYPVPQGRFFVRHQKADRKLDLNRPMHRPAGPSSVPASIIVGVVEVPRETDFERLHDVRLNSKLWMDVERSAVSNHPWAESFGECDAGSLLGQLEFRRCLLPDQLQVFVRQTMLKHEDPYRRWAYIFGVALGKLDAAPKEGLYELGAPQGPRLIDANPYTGESVNQVLRECLWGPGGQYGLAASMEPKTYRAWIDGERTRNGQQDPRFARFMAAVQKAAPQIATMEVYTAEQQKQQDQLYGQIMKQIMSDQDEPQTAAEGTAQEQVAQAEASRPRDR